MQIIGHRGARHEAPENTLGGFKYLRNLGIRTVEFDVRQLPDGTLFVMHDDNFLRTTGIEASIAEQDTTSIQQFDHRSHWNDWHQAEPTPLLNEVLQVLEDFDHIEVEIKTVKDNASAERLVETLHHQLEDFQHMATITSFDEKILAALQNAKSPFKRGLLVESQAEIAIDKALNYDCQRIGWMNQLATKQRIQDTLAENLAVSVWTVNDVDRAKQLQDFGVQGLITDLPKLMQQQL
ncbi:MAG: glycerophosphodiester phosphodiesterase [Acinetobacter sp.]